MDTYRVLAVNPGSTSTKIAIYDDEKEVFELTLRHSAAEIAKYKTIFDQYAFRKQVILDALTEAGINLTKLGAVVGRGGLLKPISGGTYAVSDKMLEDLRIGVSGQHASNLGGVIAHEIAANLNIPAYIVDPVVVDELQDVARISGMPEIDRISIFHALNQKAVARRVARDMGKNYAEINAVVAHLGGGITVGAHQRGVVIDVNNGLDGEGPFSPERCGSMPVCDLAKLCYSGKYDFEEMKKLIKGRGGLVAHLGTNDGRKVTEMIAAGDQKAELIYRAMAYQISKEIGAAAVVLKGDVDVIIITGGLAYDRTLMRWIEESVEFLGKVVIYPGEDEMLALALGGLRVLKGEERAKEYQ